MCLLACVPRSDYDQPVHNSLEALHFFFHYVLEQDTLSSALYWLNLGRQEIVPEFFDRHIKQRQTKYSDQAVDAVGKHELSCWLSQGTHA